MSMVKLRPLTLLLIMLSAIVTGCKKDPKDNSTVTIVNRIDRAITLDLYANAEDYATNSNLVDRIVVPANGNASLPGSTFISGNTYYMDWYSEDYYYNNWYNDDYPVTVERVRITPKAGANTYYLEPGYKGNARNAFLKGANTETTWIAIGAYLYSSTFGYSDKWNVIDMNERFRQVKVKKGFTAEYMRRDNDGHLVTENIPFMVQQSEVPYIEFKTGSGQAAGNMTGGKHPYATPPDYESNSIDTIMALFPDNEYIFLMVRQ